MSGTLQVVYLARHGETAWSVTGQHTGLTDLPLTERGERNARQLGARLAGLTFAAVFSSPLQRAFRTCELSGFGGAAVIDPDLVEWDYGAYEGRTSADILKERPDWQLFRDGCPDGETPRRASARGPRHRAHPSGRRRCASLFERPLHTGAGGAMGRGRTVGARPEVHADDGEPERRRLRTEPHASRGSSLERRPSCRRRNRVGNPPGRERRPYESDDAALRAGPEHLAG